MTDSRARVAAGFTTLELLPLYPGESWAGRGPIAGAGRGHAGPVA